MDGISNTQFRAIDRKGGACLALAWPADLPPPNGLTDGNEQPATAAQHIAAARIIAPIAASAGLVHIATLATILPPTGTGAACPMLLAHVVTPRWQRVTRPGAQVRALRGTWSLPISSARKL